MPDILILPFESAYVPGPGATSTVHGPAAGHASPGAQQMLPGAPPIVPPNVPSSLRDMLNPAGVPGGACLGLLPWPRPRWNWRQARRRRTHPHRHLRLKGHHRHDQRKTAAAAWLPPRLLKPPTVGGCVGSRRQLLPPGAVGGVGIQRVLRRNGQCRDAGADHP